MTTLTPGLVSLALRKSKPEDIVRFATQAKLEAVEWSSLAHNPLGKESVSKEIAQITSDAGLKVVGFGSQHRVGDTTKFAVSLDREIAAAVALGSPSIRVFVGTMGSEDVLDSTWRGVSEQLAATAQKANDAGLTLMLEFQGNTFNDTPDSSLRLLKSVEGAKAKTYWQPDFAADDTAWQGALRPLLSRLGGIHVFYWKEGQRVGLDQGYREWMQIINLLKERDISTPLLIELVEGDHPENLIRDGATLIDLIRGKQRDDSDDH